MSDKIDETVKSVGVFMNQLVNRLQKDLEKLQNTINKEGTDLLDKVMKLDLKDNLTTRKKDLEKVIDAKLGKIEPVYQKVMTEIRKNAKKAGIDLVKVERELKKQAKAAGKTIQQATGNKQASKSSTSKKKSVKNKKSPAKRTSTKKKASTKPVSAKKKVAKKTPVKKKVAKKATSKKSSVTK